MLNNQNTKKITQKILEKRKYIKNSLTCTKKSILEFILLLLLMVSQNKNSKNCSAELKKKK